MEKFYRRSLVQSCEIVKMCAIDFSQWVGILPKAENSYVKWGKVKKCKTS